IQKLVKAGSAREAVAAIWRHPISGVRARCLQLFVQRLAFEARNYRIPLAIANQQRRNVGAHMSDWTHPSVKCFVLFVIRSYSMKQNAKARAGIIWDSVVGSAKRNLSSLIGHEIIGTFAPKPYEIRWRNITEATRDPGADPFESNRCSAIGKIL